jgi:D-alanyl-D-alanine carboxypeptidase/D-alanyl-D-alanine-endopeptidase (penicillin-binding protein 4)
MTHTPNRSNRTLRRHLNAIRRWLICAALLGIAGVAAAQTPATVSGLQQQIDAYIAQPQFARADWGIAVRSLDTGKVLYAHNADRLFVPASNAKLFTAGLALAELGNQTRIATTLYATTSRVGTKGTLRGDLILYGRGDPSLGTPEGSADWADRMAAALAQLGVQRIGGNLIADATYFSGPTIGAGWEANDLQTWYGAAPSALDVGGNLLKVTVARNGRRCCSVNAVPDAAGVQIVNQTANTGGAPLSLFRPVGSSTLFASGELPARAQQHVYTLSLPDPARAAATTLRQALARRGITLDGEVTVLRWPQTDPALTQPGTQAIASIDSPPVAALVDHMLKHSDNLYAQALWLQTGVAAAERNTCSLPRKPDTSSNWALCALRDSLARAGIPPSAVLLSEGSGLARRDLVTPNALVQWLAWTQAQAWGQDLRNALPVAGIDGTLEYRFRDGAATGNLQAKTGTLSHDYTLAGFVTDAAGDHLVFSIMLNRYPRWEVAKEFPNAPAPKHALDAIAALLARHGAR